MLVIIFILPPPILQRPLTSLPAYPLTRLPTYPLTHLPAYPLTHSFLLLYIASSPDTRSWLKPSPYIFLFGQMDMAKILISYNKSDHAYVDDLKKMLNYPTEEYFELVDRSPADADITDESQYMNEVSKKVDTVDAVLYLQGFKDRRTRFISHQLEFALKEHIPVITIRIGDQQTPLPDSIANANEVSFDEKHIKLEIWNQLKKLYV